MTTLTLLRRTRASRDAHGNDVFTTARVPVPHCLVWRGLSTEADDAPTATPSRDGRDTVRTQITVVFPHGTAITSLDAVEYQGGVYEVRGDGTDWVSPLTGWTPGVLVLAEKMTG